MEFQEFFQKSLFLDLEIDKTGKIYDVGAFLGKETFRRNQGDNPKEVLWDLNAFASKASFLVGHNILDHDLPRIRDACPDLSLLTLPAVDTLLLSPLAFPENPYHRLIKDYKLLKDSQNDPVADCRLAAEVLKDEWGSFKKGAATGSDLLSFYRFCFSGLPHAHGVVGFFDAIGANVISKEVALKIFQKKTKGLICTDGFQKHITPYFKSVDKSLPLSYCLAWLCVSGGNSILPHWVRNRFPKISPLLHLLRDKPCGKDSCGYCFTAHNPVSGLKKYFGFNEFRKTPATKEGKSLQQEIVTSAAKGDSLFALLPTGGGKSICFQLPALMRHHRCGSSPL
ncbi:MAG: hypothetical protein ACE5FU_10750 [Nitrospinota bacterium]